MYKLTALAIIFYAGTAFADNHLAKDEELKNFSENLPMTIFCIPDSVIGFERDIAGIWHPGQFKPNIKDRFIATISKFSPDDSICSNNAKNNFAEKYYIKEGKIFCIKWSYMTTEDNEFGGTCIANPPVRQLPFSLTCGKDLLIVPNENYYLETSNVSLSLILKGVLISKGSCTKLNTKSLNKH
ncbi:MAG: hypothetical protein AB7D28_03870 [Candidatus Berkiella sp.]